MGKCRITMVLALLTLMLLFVTGCSSAPSIEGEWTASPGGLAYRWGGDGILYISYYDRSDEVLRWAPTASYVVNEEASIAVTDLNDTSRSYVLQTSWVDDDTIDVFDSGTRLPKGSKGEEYQLLRMGSGLQQELEPGAQERLPDE